MTTDYENLMREKEFLEKRLELLKIQEHDYQQEIDLLETSLKEWREYFKSLYPVQQILYDEIVHKGKKVTKAVDITSMLTGYHPSTIWTQYYPKMKPYLKKAFEEEKAFDFFLK